MPPTFTTKSRHVHTTSGWPCYRDDASHMQEAISDSKKAGKEHSAEEPSAGAPLFQRTLSEALLNAHNNRSSKADVISNAASMRVVPVATSFSGGDLKQCTSHLTAHDTHACTESAASKTPGSLRVVSSSSGHHEVCLTFPLFKRCKIVFLVRARFKQLYACRWGVRHLA